MPQRRKKNEVSTSLVLAALVSAIVSGVTAAGALSLAENIESHEAAGYSGMSANPYRPILVPGRGGSTAIPGFRQKLRLPKATLERKIKTLKRSVASAFKRLNAAEKRLDSAESALARALSDADKRERSATVEALRAKILKLDDRHADLQSQLAEYELDLQSAE